jgi:hypothetical protein
MKDKTLLSIYLPATQSTFELWVPDSLTIHDTIELACLVMQEQVGRRFSPSKDTALYTRTSGEELDVNMRVADYGFVNGSQLVLM